MRDRSRLLLLAVLGWEGFVFVHFMARSGFVWDDLVNFRLAETKGLSFAYLTGPLFEQFAPGHKFFDWVLQRFFPMDFTAAIAISLVFFIASAYALYRLLRELFGPGMGPVLLTALFCASLVNVGTAQWWAAGIHRLPSTALTLVAMLAFVRFHRTGDRSRLALSVGAMAVGALFSFSALFVPLYLLLLVVFVLEPERRTRRVQMWLPYVGVVVAAAVAYLVWVAAPLKYSDPVAIGRYIVDSWAQVFVPGLIGLNPPAGHLSARWLAAVLFVQALLGAVVVASVIRKPGAWRAWAFLAIGAVASSAFVGATRLNGASPSLIAHGYRYLADLNFLFPIALGAAFAGAAPRADARRALAVVLAAELILTWAGDAAITAPSVWFGGAAATYAANMRSGVARARRSAQPVVVVDSNVPEYLVPVLFAPYNRVGEVLPLFDRRVTVGTQGSVWEVTPTGSLMPVTFAARAGGDIVQLQRAHQLVVRQEQTSTERGGALCVESGAKQAVVALGLLQPLTDATWHLVFDYTSSTTGGMYAFVYRGDTWVAAPDPLLPVERGSHTLTVDLGGPRLDALLLELPVHSTVCMRSLTIGALVSRAVSR